MLQAVGYYVYSCKNCIVLIFRLQIGWRLLLIFFSSITLDGHTLKYVNEVRYLGHIITDKLKDDADIVRELRKSYTRINILARRFSRCSTLVKLRLQRPFLCFYGVATKHCGKTTLKAHLINYDLVITNVLKYFLAILNFTVLLPYFWNCLPSFCTLVYNSQYRFRHQWINCTNNIVKL